MRRVVGDIYQVQIEPEKTGFIQHIGSDSSQLHSHVICAFRAICEGGAEVELDEVAQSGAAFYAHVLLQAGEVLKIWRKVGRRVAQGLPENLVWYKSADAGNLSYTSKSDQWFMWKTNGTLEKVGSHNSALSISDLGVVMAPQDIVDRLRLGCYTSVYPRISKT